MSENQQKPKKPLITVQAIALLRGMIKLLEGIVAKLEAAPVTKPAPVVESSTTGASQSYTNDTSESILLPGIDGNEQDPPTTDLPKEDALSTTTAKPDINDTREPAMVTSTSDIPTVTPETTEEPVDDWVSPPQKTKLTDRLLPSFNPLQTFWGGLLAKVRSLFPASWSEKLSDRGLTAAIATIIVAVLFTTVALLPQTTVQEEKAKKAEKAPPSTTIAAPPELTAPDQPKAVAVEPPPPPVLTPEQSLISGIRNQVAAITEEYGEGLIKAIQANFLESRLIVKVSDSWYELEAQQQDKLADQILAQAMQLDFSKLAINDLEGTLIARNPVVGQHTVILKRY
ncbi:MAG: hypothetical protein F6J92_24710 [Symploca sp. SIO1A3]|nr:hypothetical protein [Symploca sp. SIO1A3]